MRNNARLAMAAAFLATIVGPWAARADTLLTGMVASAGGEKLGGVTVSAKADSASITTTVFTDDSGTYYFPVMPDGKYRVWAQALTFETAKAQVDLPSTPRQDF